MNDLEEALKTNAISKVVIVDDAFDQIPLAQDLALEESEWIQFFEDLPENDQRLLESEYPGFCDMRADDLMSDNSFVAILWKVREKLVNRAVDGIFERYSVDHMLDMEFLVALKEKIERLGLNCETSGREFSTAAYDADILIVDLFLGSLQDDLAFSQSADGLKNVIATRRKEPPLVILMSRSTRLTEKRAAFRDRAELIESCFRIIQKADITQGDQLSKVMLRLVSHRGDTHKLAAFLFALEEGISGAGKNALSSLRRLALSDHAQIQELLLNEEGESIGAYLVDIFDGVFIHQLERDRSIVEAAVNLPIWDQSTLPPPYVSGSKDLQHLVYETMFHNKERLELARVQSNRLTFGDLLRWKSPVEGKSESNQASELDSGERDFKEIFAIMTPACDLQHDCAAPVLLLRGTLEALHPSKWVYTDGPVRTAVVILGNDQRYRIRWDLKDFRTMGRTELAESLVSNEGLGICARLRYVYALELQQKFLASLGRVGVLAPMPATFTVDISLHCVSPDGTLFEVAVPALAHNGAVTFFGRNKDGSQFSKLILCEDSCDGIYEALLKIDAETVHPLAKKSLLAVRDGNKLVRLLERGLSAPVPSDTGLKELRLLDNETTVGFLSRSVPERFTKNPQIEKAGFVLRLRSLE